MQPMHPAKRKTAPTRSAELVNITSSAPLELVCVDYLSLERSKGGFENILVVTDHFTRYAQAIPTRNQTARTTARVLFDSFIVHYGFPATIHSDRGQNFESKIIEGLCAIAGIRKSRTTPYHPMGNGMVERFNQTLLKMLGTLQDDQKSDWKAHVPTWCMRTTVHSMIVRDTPPYYLMYGRHPRLAIDAFLGLKPDDVSAKCPSEYIQKLNSRLELAYAKAGQESKQSAQNQKRQYDKGVRHSVLKPGDIVLVRNVGLRGKQKLADRWERQPYIVKRQPIPDIPVYEVTPDHERKRKSRTVHRNLLLPFMCVSPTPESRSRKATPAPTVNVSRDSAEPYVIPMRRKTGQPGLVPRSTSLTDDETGVHRSRSSSESEETEDDTSNSRPRRQTKQPAWMTTGDWVLPQAQEHIFTVPRDQVILL